MTADDGGGDDDEVDESDGKPDAEVGDNDHLADVPDGAGCTEIWEHLSSGRDED